MIDLKQLSVYYEGHSGYEVLSDLVRNVGLQAVLNALGEISTEQYLPFVADFTGDGAIIITKDEQRYIVKKDTHKVYAAIYKEGEPDAKENNSKAQDE